MTKTILMCILGLMCVTWAVMAVWVVLNAARHDGECDDILEDDPELAALRARVHGIELSGESVDNI